MGFIQDLAAAMMRQEGNAPGTRADRNNNPGNIWDGLAPGKTKRIWPNIPIDDKGYLVFPTKEAGRAAMERDLSIKVNRGMTLEQLINQYAPAGKPQGDQAGLPANQPAVYATNVARWLGIPTNVDLRKVSAGWQGGTGSWPASPGSASPPDDSSFPTGRPVAPPGGQKSRRK